MSGWETDYLTSVAFQRLAAGFLRRWMPVFRFRSTVIVALHADVLDVLSRDEEFTISQINANRTDADNGPFVLSMDRGPQHDREKELLNQLVNPGDIGRIREIVETSAAECVEAALPKKRIDVVGELSRVVPMRLLDLYFGMPGPDQPTMMHWMRALFYDIFFNFSSNPKISNPAHAAFAELKPYMLQRIAERKSLVENTPDGHISAIGDNILTRMLLLQGLPKYAEWLDDDTIRRCLGGLIIGAVDTTNKVAVQALDQLLDRPEALRKASAAACDGDMDTVRRYAYEALRLDPHNPVVLRYAAQPAEIGGPSGHPYTVPAGCTIAAATLSAMFDPAAFKNPKVFDPNRDVPYLHFGYGLHTCQGRHINGVQIPGILSALLRLPNLRRAPGADGQIAFEGPFPNRMILEFD